MASTAEDLFERLQSKADLESLIGQPEDADFDCKEWPSGSDAAKGTIAKAACGFANATGGVLVIGMRASGGRSGTPDVVEGLTPVRDAASVASQALDIILKQVEPGIEGIRTRVIRDPSGPHGYVILFVPSLDDAPRRSKQDWRFYVRVASGTRPMEYFQIEDRFGRRPHPRLVIDLAEPETRTAIMSGGQIERFSRLSIRNDGRGMARFPAVRIFNGSAMHISSSPLPYDRLAWQQPTADGEWVYTRGGSNDVIYPGETLTVLTLIQPGKQVGPSRPSTTPVLGSVRDWQFPMTEVLAQVMCEGMAAREQKFSLEDFTYSPS